MKAVKILYRLIVPGGVVLLVAYLLMKMGMVANPGNHQLYFYAAIIFAIGLILSGVFHRSRLFFTLIVISASYCALIWLAPRLSPLKQQVIFNAIALLVPLNCMGFAFLRERGVISPAGERRLAFISLQLIGISVLTLPIAAEFATLLEHRFIPARFSDWSRMPQPALAAFLVAALVLAAALARRYRAVESSILWSLVCVFIALRAGAATSVAAIYFGAAGLLLVIAVLETSYSMAYRDELTRLPSRRALNEALLKLGDSYAIAMLDVDHFKKFNDTYGHEAGDQALQMVASKLAHVTGGGKAYRYGGEEFAVIFPGRPAEEAFTYLDRMRRLIEQSRFVVRGGDRRTRRGKKPRRAKGETNVTVSIGIAASDTAKIPVDQVLRSADEALYQAKAKGRNCTVLARSAKPGKSTDLKIRVLQVS
jgi:diguanylate cyclase (GGDEF)-like protein